MIYYNPSTGEIKSRYEIKKLFPLLSLKKDFESFRGWYRLYDGVRPETDDTHYVVECGVLEIGGRWTRQYRLEVLSDEELLHRAKDSRKEEVSKLTVEVDGMVFDANETAQERMVRAILGHTEGDSFRWVLADNSVVEIGVSILREALSKAVEDTGNLWCKVYG